MSALEARLRRRIFGTRLVKVFVGDECPFQDDDVVKVRVRGRGVRLWVLWDDEVREYLFPACDEVRVMKP